MKIPIKIDQDSRRPIYDQIEQQIKALIVAGQLEPNDPLPSIRALAKELSCSVITTRRAYQNLEQQGFIKTTQGKGTFVAMIEQGKKEETKKITVYETLHEAIWTARRHNYSYDQIQTIIDEIMSELKEEE